MKNKGVIAVLLISIAAVVGIAVFLVIRNKRNGSNKYKSSAETEGDSSVSAPTPAVSDSPTIGGGTLSSLTNIASNIGSVFGNNGVTFDANERSITVDGQKYVIPSRQRVKEVQRSLIEGFESYADLAGTQTGKEKYLQLAADMKRASKDGTGVDGLIGKATANEFAVAAKLMPSVVNVFKV